MTGTSTRRSGPATPSSVRLGELAMAAGLAGDSVTLCYYDFPAPVLSGIWQHHARAVGPDAVHHIHTQKDLNKLPSRMAQVRVVIVHTPRLHIPAAWSIQMAAPADGISRPAMFSRLVPSDLAEDPGATLVVRATPQENEDLAHWLATQGNASPGEQPSARPSTVDTPGWLSRILAADPQGSSPIRHWYRESQILRAFVAGACVLRTSCSGAGSEAEANVTPEDYGYVRQLLRSPILRSADATCNPLATAMVGRANVYLAARSGEIHRNGTPLPGGEFDHIHDDDEHPRKELITRREVADLGNVESGLVRRLVTYLHQDVNGYEWYRRMGTARRPPNRSAWLASPVDLLAANLLGWSVKRVRSHFDRLQRDGLIAAERDHGNGPWRYALPEELSDASFPFHRFPQLTRLETCRGEENGDEADTTPAPSARRLPVSAGRRNSLP
ncbi:MAG: hypothetical protein NTY19_43670 [Planctomycetota bacterium]|nr:hypothetical protein [Planctomycetota bacterium]